MGKATVELGRCPCCGQVLLWNGRGMLCIACAYHRPTERPPYRKRLAKAKSSVSERK